ncbi:ABC transporter ATP-binding protein [Tateyamaria omphalii]|uniref:Multidrug ABC transporter ATP-binding protein n=1 Tax=Tateyamaria omphalii TaxID=299262 RepID=A0A1P8MYH0_9RHOB|nr:ABC transporter ATP-binding protein [Tateyamaria omphalii]APX13135.1 multidrug ABC transporter ATP-binding protein [Tateyamaria omphalii]
MFKFFESLVDPYQSYTEADTPPTNLWPFLWNYLKPFRWVMTITFVFSTVVAFGEILLIWYVARIVDLLAQGTPEAIIPEYGLEFMLVALWVVVLRTMMAFVDVALLHNTLLPNLGTLIRWRSHRHVLRQSVGWFEDDFAGRIANRIMQTPPAAGEAMFQVLDAGSFFAVSVIGAVILLMSFDLWLALPLIFWIVGYLLLLRWVIHRAGPAAKASSDARSAITGRVVDSYTNIHSVKMFAHHDREINYAKDAIEGARQTFMKEMRIVVKMDVALTVLNASMIVSMGALAIWLWFGGFTTEGMVAAALTIALRLNNMTYWIMWAMTSLVQNLGIISEGMETIAQPVTLVDAPDAKALEMHEGKIALHDLTHHYGRDSGGLEAVSAVIHPGEKVGLVGRSGAGKSTLVKLLLRFYDAEGGRIEIDGQDIAKVTQDSLRLNVGMVQQDSSLLHRSVRDNILYGRPNATEEEMFAAARQAQAHDFILDLADPEGRTGYDAQVGERGVKLSGGQRQRITLARVILKNAPILVLDEATSALDSEVEAAIQDTLYKMMEGKTVIAIAHRLSTIAQMDRILVLDDGKIAEDGSHDALLAQGGLYAELWARQSGGFIATEAAE